MVSSNIRLHIAYSTYTTENDRKEWAFSRVLSRKKAINIFCAFYSSICNLTFGNHSRVKPLGGLSIRQLVFYVLFYGKAKRIPKVSQLKVNLKCCSSLPELLLNFNSKRTSYRNQNSLTDNKGKVSQFTRTIPFRARQSGPCFSICAKYHASRLTKIKKFISIEARRCINAMAHKTFGIFIEI